MRAEHVEAMERTEALMREGAQRPGHNFGHSVVPPLVGFVVIAVVIGFVFVLDTIESDSVRFTLACGVPLGLVFVLGFGSFMHGRLTRRG